MVLRDVCLYGENDPCHIHITNGIIAGIGGIDANDELHVELNGAIALPGFINSHDHLDFNCYPQLGNRIYNSYTEWGPDIQQTHAETIRQVQQVPGSLRIAWGLFKNLFNGFTTVVNHGKKLDVEDELISVFQECTPLHSPAFEKRWKWKLRNPFLPGPFVMHIGEGTDQLSTNEVIEVGQANLFRKKIIAVHGVAMKEEQAKVFEGLVWCPASNYFLLDKTAAVEQLKNKLHVVFGTDSTLTSSWNIQQHLQAAKGSGMVSEQELLSMLTINPAALWKIQDRGKLKVGKTADIIVIKPGTSIFDLRPDDILLVIHRGNIRLADEIFTGKRQLCSLPYSRVRLGDTVKQVRGRPFDIAQEIKKYYPSLFIPFTNE